MAVAVVLVPVALLALLLGAPAAGGASWGEAALFGGVVLVPAFAVGMVVGQRRTLVDALRERNAYLERTYHLADVRARLEERADRRRDARVARPPALRTIASIFW
ncbi:hypothetical protein [Streptomyces sp. NPDC002521]